MEDEHGRAVGKKKKVLSSSSNPIANIHGNSRWRMSMAVPFARNIGEGEVLSVGRG